MEVGTGDNDGAATDAALSVPPDSASIPSVGEERERTALDVANRTDQHSTVEARGEERPNQRTDESGRDLAPVQPPRDLHLEQELVDYEIEEGDMIPESTPTHTKPAATGGDKPQPAKISWNEWASADADVAKRTEGKRRDSLEGMQRVSADSRPARDSAREGRGRYRHDGSRYHRDNRHHKDGSPKRPFRGSHTRSVERSMRSGMTTMHSNIPPGMNRGHLFGPQQFMPSGMEPLHRSVRPAAARMMPPGLGVSGSIPRDTQYHARVPMDNRRYPIRDNRRRSISPQRFNVPPRRASPERFRRPQRPMSPYRSGNLMPMENRPRSPYGNRPPFHNDYYAPNRATERNGPPQERDGDDNRRRPNNYYPRNKEFARASPRRFIPEKQQVFQRQLVPRFNDDDHYRHSGNPNRMPVAGHWPSPREQRRRPMTPERPGLRHPSPTQQLKRYIRDVSPSRHRRDMGSPPRGSEHPGRSAHMHGRGRPPNLRMDPDYQRRFEGVHRRYDDRRREPPSPGRSKRQRQSPMAEQRSQREAAHLRGAVKSPHENPPNTDGMPGGRLHHSETDCCWFYVDPQGNTQGPCTIAQFRSWLRTLADDPQFADEYKQFMSVEVWKEGIAKRHLMTELLEKNVA